MTGAAFQPTSNTTLTEALGQRSIVFVGMMGSGKTAIGKLLASILQLPFYDSDHEIVAAANMEIPEIFSLHGEAYFRAGEEKVIARLLAGGPAVISLGGGAFISPATREQIAKHAISIWLTADLDLLMHRVMRRPSTRPLLQTADPKATLAALMEKREPVYAEADLHIPSSKSSKNETRDAVIRALSEYLMEHSK